MSDIHGQLQRDAYALAILAVAGFAFLALLGTAPFARLRVALLQTQKARLVDFLIALSGHIRAGAKPEEALAHFVPPASPMWIAGIAQEWAARIAAGKSFADAAPSVLVAKSEDRVLLSQAVNAEQLAAGVQNLASAIRIRSGAGVICALLAFELFGGIILNLVMIDQAMFGRRMIDEYQSRWSSISIIQRLVSESDWNFLWAPTIVILALIAVTALFLFRTIREPRGDYARASRSQVVSVFAASDTLRTLRYFKLGLFVFGVFFCGYLLSISFLIVSSLFKQN